MAGTIKYHIDALPDILNKLKIDENRFINCCLLETDQRTKFHEESYYPVDIDRYAFLGNITKKVALEELIEICQRHKSNSLAIEVKIGDRIGTLHTSLIYEYITIEDRLEINWNPKFIPYISGKIPPTKFLTINSVMDAVSSNRRYCMYVLLTQHIWKFEHQESFTITKEVIRTSLGLETGQYKQFSVLRSKIIVPTLKEIKNKLDIDISCRLFRGMAIFTIDR